jgi:hypothetical protein
MAALVLNVARFKALMSTGKVEIEPGIEITLGQDVGWAQVFTIVANGMAESAKCSIKKAERGW